MRSGNASYIFASALCSFQELRDVDPADHGQPDTPRADGVGIGQYVDTYRNICGKSFFQGWPEVIGIFPTVIIRPGKPNAAASSFASGVFREPLNGVECLLPVGLDTVMPVAGYRTIVEGFQRLYEADGSALGDDRAVGFPAMDASVEAMIAALKRVAANRKLGAIRHQRDPAIEHIVAGWPTGTSFERALALGLPRDPDLDSIVRAYIEDFLAG